MHTNSSKKLTRGLKKKSAGRKRKYDPDMPTNFQIAKAQSNHRATEKFLKNLDKFEAESRKKSVVVGSNVAKKSRFINGIAFAGKSDKCVVVSESFSARNARLFLQKFGCTR